MLNESFFTDYLNKPTRFLDSKDTEVYSIYLSATKQFFTEAVSNDPAQLAILDQLVTEGFDSNQVWEQIQLLNQNGLNYLHAWMEEHVVEKEEEENRESEHEYEEMLEDGMEVDGIEESQEEFGSEPGDELEEYEEGLSDEDTDTPKKSIVDDDFFSLERMEQFTDIAEKRDIRMARGDISEDEDQEDMFSIGRGLFL
jgi:U3 small nucleolar RNA-associated protein MPP10